MRSRRRRFRRRLGERRYRKVFVIAVEGAKTEPQYFALFNDQHSAVQVRCLKAKHDNSPPRVLKRMRDHLRRQELKPTDEAWLVVDRDQWTDEQLAQLHGWAQERESHGFALSNPKFEYWLLLHFEAGNDIASSQDCTNRLKRYLPNYNKEIHARMFTRERIRDAIRRARQRDNPRCRDWPRMLGGTTVYKLVQNILRNLA